MSGIDNCVPTRNGEPKNDYNVGNARTTNHRRNKAQERIEDVTYWNKIRTDKAIGDWEDLKKIEELCKRLWELLNATDAQSRIGRISIAMKKVQRIQEWVNESDSCNACKLVSDAEKTEDDLKGTES